MPDLDVIVKAFGPAGAPLLLLAGALWWQLHTKTRTDREDAKTRDADTSKVREQLIAALVDNATATKSLAASLADHERHEREMIGTLTDVLAGKLEHAINNGFHVLRLTLDRRER